MNLQNREIIINNYEKLNCGEIAASLEDFAEDALNHGVKVGRDGIAMVLADIYQTFPDWNFEIIDLATEGDSVVVRSKVKGTHLGIGKLPVNGGMMVAAEPTGKSFAAEHIHWYKLRDGKIVEHFAVRDDIGMMQQLGLLQSPSDAQNVN
jgi:predicted ester cyclase